MDYKGLSSLIVKKSEHWTQGDVLTWLSFIGLETVAPSFCKLLFHEEKLAIDGNDLKLLNENRLIQ
jgi:hypothetical protein